MCKPSGHQARISNFFSMTRHSDMRGEAQPGQKGRVQGGPGGSDGKESTCDAGDLGSILGSGRSPGEGNDNWLQYSCLENSMDRGAWWARVHGVAGSGTTGHLTLAMSWAKHKTATNKTEQLQFFNAGAFHAVSHSNTWATWCQELTHWKRPWRRGRLEAGGEGTTEDEVVGWHHRLDGHEFEQTPGDSEGQGSLACCSPRGRKESDTTERLNWRPVCISKSWKKNKFPRSHSHI